MTTHTLFDGRVQIYRRGDAKTWQCATRIDGQRFRESTKEEDLSRAKDVAEDWYLGLRGRRRSGELPKPKKKERLFKDAAAEFMREFKVLAMGTRSPKYVELNELRLNVHVLPFFGNLALAKVNAGTCQQYVMARTEATQKETGNIPARSTLKQELVVVRQVLKWAANNHWIPYVPNLTLPYLTLKKKGRRAWFSPEEYKQLYTAARKRIKDGARPGWKAEYEELLDYILFMANSGLRPDEAKNLEFRDVMIEDDEVTGETILVLDVRGKIGVGFAVTMPGAVMPLRRLKERRTLERKLGKVSGKPAGELEPDDKVFGKYRRDLFNQILKEEGLKHDRDGQSRTAYSLRHTYISMRLIDGANIHQIANNCRTSVQMIEEHYAAHLRNRRDVAAINIRKPKSKKKKPVAKSK